MKVAITQRHLKADVGSDRDALENDYTEYYSNFGMTLVPISNALKNPAKYLEELKVEAIILTGGNGVLPSLYGQEIKFKNLFSEKREITEKAIVDYAVKKRFPILGICRGLHYINVHFKGSLLQNIKEELKSKVEHVAADHELKITDKKAKILFGKEKILVNSFHNQGITKKMLSSKLKDFAVCEGDNTIEAAYHPDYPIAGITWHPERKSPDAKANEKLVKAFLDRKLFWK